MFFLPSARINSLGKRATSSARVAALLTSIFCASCGAPHAEGDQAPPGTSTLATDPPIDFSFDSLDGRPISAESTRGKPTVIVFVTTDSLAGQAQVDFLVPMAKHDAGRINYAVVALSAERELVDLYVRSLSLAFPAAILVPEHERDAAAFGDLGVLPVTVVLDPGGHLVWRAQGRVARPEELRRVIALLSR
jgi:hypothetical protein